MNLADKRLSESELRDEFTCRCGAQPKLIRKIMDPRNGTMVRIFECHCGQRTWADDKKSVAPAS
jgi:hypothetical protein